jgi:tetratricopeptide (TPR) repeat protein
MAKPKPSRQIEVDAARARDLFDEFEIGLTRGVLDVTPRHVKALEVLGQALTRTGRHQEALESDLRLSSLKPRDPVVFYNLACSYSNLVNLDGAFDALRRAFELGYNDYPHLLRDPDLENVRRDRRFKQLLDRKWGKRQP